MAYNNLNPINDTSFDTIFNTFFNKEDVTQFEFGNLNKGHSFFISEKINLNKLLNVESQNDLKFQNYIVSKLPNPQVKYSFINSVYQKIMLTYYQTMKYAPYYVINEPMNNNNFQNLPTNYACKINFLSESLVYDQPFISIVDCTTGDEHYRLIHNTESDGQKVYLNNPQILYGIHKVGTTGEILDYIDYNDMLNIISCINCEVIYYGPYTDVIDLIKKYNSGSDSDNVVINKAKKKLIWNEDNAMTYKEGNNGMLAIKYIKKIAVISNDSSYKYVPYNIDIQDYDELNIFNFNNIMLYVGLPLVLYLVLKNYLF